ncbi:hypothetical protein ABMA27_011195 [Loxostege sticticalis]|uniref:Peptidase A2 domain-containing protein n=1 Tax=Loxostege sticticalis TaxID=481309 RepID=A0ABR3H1N6_LOXSC
MEELIKLQTDNKNQITRGLTNFKKSPKERLTEAYCQIRLETLDQQWKWFTDNHLAIVKSADLEDDCYKKYVEEEIYEETEDIYIEYKSMLRCTLNKLSPVSLESSKQNSNSASNVYTHSSVKLPEICIPKFSGKYSEWATFKDMFTSLIHCNNSLENVQKLHYLKGYLTGEAEQLRLLSQRNLSSEAASGLKDLIDTTTDCLDHRTLKENALKNLKIDVSTWDILVIHILALKLDPETKKQWELHVSSNVGSDSLPTYEQFKSFITQRYRALEFVEPNKYNKAVKVDNASAATENITSCFSAGKTVKQVLLATAVVKVEAGNGSRKLVRALLDQGSQASFVTESTVQFLGLKKSHSRHIILGLGGDKKVTTNSTVTVNLQSRVNPEIKLTVKAYVLRTITAFLPAKKVVDMEGLDLTGITLADPDYHTPNKIDILLGADVYGKVLKEGLRKNVPGGLIAQATALGWIISGTVTGLHDQSNSVVVMHSIMEDNEALKRFWELENEPKDKSENQMNEEELKCEELYRNTVKRDETGRYIVKIPFKVDKPQVRGSLEIAKKRFDLLEKRLNKNEVFKSKFTEVMDEYLSSEHMELVKEEEQDNPDAVYVPILAVVREDRVTTRVRVVCDSSCKGKDGISINDLMMKGPVLQGDLRHLLMRWRKHVCCLVADITKMLLWRPDPKSAVKAYRMLRVSFGSASAPYLAVRTLQQVAHDEGDKYPEAKERTLRDFYMDDLMTGCDTEEEAIMIYKEMNEMLMKGGFELRKWTSNKEEVLNAIENGQGTGERENVNLKDNKLKIKLDDVMKILGLTWDRREDEFQYSVAVSELSEPVTKRKILSEIARLFDPLGWLSSCIILAKILIQKLWLKGLDWDEEVPADIHKQWVTYRNELPLLKEFRIPRWMGTNKNSHIELHGFADASNAAYAAVVYARVIDKENNVRVVLLTAKTKVCPIKIVSIPRLELCGAALLTKLLKEVAKVLEVDKTNIFAWTDSTVVLAWLNSQPRRWKPFVANRVSDIITSLEPSQWAHVESKENPADVASRGLYPSEILNSDIWKSGPEFLRQKEIERKHSKDLDTNVEEIKVHTVTEEEDAIWERFSSLNRLVRVVSYCRRFINSVKAKGENPKTESFLTSKELNESLNIIIRISQVNNFKEDIKALESNQEERKKSKLHLNLYLDGNRLLRVGGRLEKSNREYDEKHSILLQKHSKLSKLIAEDAHKKTLHGGKQFWGICVVSIGLLEENYS